MGVSTTVHNDLFKYNLPNFCYIFVMSIVGETTVESKLHRFTVKICIIIIALLL